MRAVAYLPSNSFHLISWREGGASASLAVIVSSSVESAVGVGGGATWASAVGVRMNDTAMTERRNTLILQITKLS